MHESANLLHLEPRPDHHNPRYSLVVATVGRTEFVGRFLESVLAQNYSNLEVLVADQNGDERLVPILNRYRTHLDIRHLRSALGLSRARNTAFRHITGDIVAFPDDDCIYPTGLLRAVAARFARFPGMGGFAAAPVSERTDRRFRGFTGRTVDLDVYNVWQLTSSIGLFLRAEVVSMVGDFDETLGLGSGTPWGAGEDRDYPLRAVDLGIRIRYDPSLTVKHPEGDYHDRSRATLYGAGLGRVLRKRSAPAAEVIRLVFLRPIGGALVSVLRGRPDAFAFYVDSLRGRIKGWLAPVD